MIGLPIIGVCGLLILVGACVLIWRWVTGRWGTNSARARGRRYPYKNRGFQPGHGRETSDTPLLLNPDFGPSFQVDFPTGVDPNGTSSSLGTQDPSRSQPQPPPNNSKGARSIRFLTPTFPPDRKPSTGASFRGRGRPFVSHIGTSHMGRMTIEPWHAGHAGYTGHPAYNGYIVQAETTPFTWGGPNSGYEHSYSENDPYAHTQTSHTHTYEESPSAEAGQSRFSD